jgi:hypothetical protein
MPIRQVAELAETYPNHGEVIQAQTVADQGDFIF